MPLDALPDPQTATTPAEADAMRAGALRRLVAHLEGRLATLSAAAPTAIEDLSLRHLAKATGTARSALSLMAETRWVDACILVRAVFEQLFSYLWVVQEPAKAEARAVMVTIKQEWANAKYLEGLMPAAAPEAAARLREAAEAYRQIAETLMAALAAELGTTEKKVRDEAKLRVSAKAVEVNLGPEFSIPYAHYSGFVHTDGNALACYAGYDPRGAAPAHVPIAADLHRALLRLAEETAARAPEAFRAQLSPELSAHAAWQAGLEAHGVASGW